MRPAIAGSRWWVLVELDAAGRVHRWSTEPLDVLDAAGRTHRYAPGLQEPDLGGGAVTVEVYDGTVDWAALRAAGTVLERSPCVVRRWTDGQTLEAAEVLVEGEATEVEWGSVGEPIRWSIAARPTSSTVYPPEAATVSTSTWPYTDPADASLPTDAQGLSYPVVIGVPPRSPAILVEWQVASPENSKLLICDGAAAATQIVVRDLSDGAYASRAVTVGVDLLGRVVSTCLFGGFDRRDVLISNRAIRNDLTTAAEWAGDLVPDPSHEYEIDWSGTLGAALGVRALGDVLVWALGLLGAGYDLEAQTAEVARLAAYQVDAAISERVDLAGWVEALGEVYPLEQRDGPRGRWYALAEPSAPVAHLDASRMVRRGGVRMREPEGGIATSILLRYGPDGDSYRYERTIDSSTDPIALAGELVYGVIPLEIEAPTVWDAATAALILRSAIRRRALPSETIAYETAGEDLDRLEVGDWVELTDDELSLAAVLARVDELVASPSTPTAILLVLYAPERL